MKAFDKHKGITTLTVESESDFIIRRGRLSTPLQLHRLADATPILQHLEISSSLPNQPHFLQQLLPQLQHLRTLKLSNLAMFNKSSSLATAWPPTLQQLKLRLCTMVRYSIFKTAARSISVESCKGLGPALTFMCPALHSLEFEGTNCVDSIIMEECLNLRTLDITETSISKVDIPPSVCFFMAKNCIFLEEVDCSKCTDLSEVYIGGCSQLKTLDLSFKQDLSYLQIHDCGKLATVDTTACHMLMYPDDDGVLLESVDLKRCPALKWVGDDRILKSGGEDSQPMTESVSERGEDEEYTRD